MRYRRQNKTQHSSKLHIVKYAGLFLCIAFVVAGAVFFIGMYRARYFRVPSLNTVYIDWENKVRSTINSSAKIQLHCLSTEFCTLDYKTALLYVCAFMHTL